MRDRTATRSWPSICPTTGASNTRSGFILWRRRKRFGTRADDAAPPVSWPRQRRRRHRYRRCSGDSQRFPCAPRARPPARGGSRAGFSRPYVFPVLAKNAALNVEHTNIVPLVLPRLRRRARGVRLFGRRFLKPRAAASRAAGAHRVTSSGWWWDAGISRSTATHFSDLEPRIRISKSTPKATIPRFSSSLSDLISARRPFLKAEVHKLITPAARERLYDFLVQLGYDVFLAETDAPHKNPPLARSDVMRRAHYDIFCIPQ